MALKDRLRSKRSKRFSYVDIHSKPEKMNVLSDSESKVFVMRKKVRKDSATKKLLKESECFTVDSDHIYTSMKSPGTDDSAGRKREMSEKSEKPVKKRCFSKNAVMARLNRERKKKYVSTLETENESLRKENREMKQRAEDQSKKISLMRREILYLKGLLANSKELGQILTNLKLTTGLPVTSSLILTTEGQTQNDNFKKSLMNEEDIKNLEDYQPRVKYVNSGFNFPIIDKDINLGNFSDNSSSEYPDLENCPFDFENDSFDASTLSLNDENSLFNYSSTQTLDSELEDWCKLDYTLEKNNPHVGICLHVSQKKISVEVCSVCNSKAGSVPDEMFSV